MNQQNNVRGDRKLVSIVIPTFNRAEMLRKAIDSSLEQNYNVEVIVVNHGSDDHTDDVVATYGSQIKYLRRDQDFGPHFCWLDGVLHARGEFVHLQFDDDWISPSFIERCMAVVNERVGFSFSIANVVDDKNNKIHMTLFDDWLPESGIYHKKKIERRILRSLISPGAAIYRKQILLDSLYQGRLPLSETDYRGVGPDCFVTLLSMLRYPEIGFVKEPLANFRMHDNSITINASQDRARQRKLKRAYKEVKRFYLEMKLLRFFRKLTRFN